MTLSPAQAADSLKEIDKTGRRSASAYGYGRSSPYLILWGVVWVLGYGGSAILPPHDVGLAWLGLDFAGLLGSAVIGYSQNRGKPADSEARRSGRRFFASFFLIVLFIVASTAVMKPATALQQAAFWPLVIAMFYAILGLWKGMRFVATGVALTVLTLVGFFYLPGVFYYWMAACGGGALILAGLWFRQV